MIRAMRVLAIWRLSGQGDARGAARRGPDSFAGVRVGEATVQPIRSKHGRDGPRALVRPADISTTRLTWQPRHTTSPQVHDDPERGILVSGAMAEPVNHSRIGDPAASETAVSNPILCRCPMPVHASFRLKLLLPVGSDSELTDMACLVERGGRRSASMRARPVGASHPRAILQLRSRWC
jgi:hypothetical protein